MYFCHRPPHETFTQRSEPCSSPIPCAAFWRLTKHFLNDLGSDLVPSGWMTDSAWLRPAWLVPGWLCFQLAGISCLRQTLANSGCNWCLGWKSAMIELISRPLETHLAHGLAQYEVHFRVDLLLNYGIIWGVIIMRFHCKYHCFHTL